MRYQDLGRRAGGLLGSTAMAAWLLIGAPSALAQPAAAPSVEAFRLSKGDAARLAVDAANGEPVLVIAAAARAGRIGELAEAVAKLGGRVDYRLDAIDYLTAVLPSDKVVTFLRDPALEAAAVDNMNDKDAEQSFALPSGKESGGGEGAAAAAPPSADAPTLPARPLDQAYSVLRDMNGTAFQARDPRFDGRGVVIGQVETFPDFLLPEMQTALDATGKPIAKFAGIVRAPATAASLDPSAAPAGEGWSSLLGPVVESRDGALIVGERRFTVPRAGAYRMASLSVPRDSWLGKCMLAALGRAVPSGKVPAADASAALSFDLLWSDADETLGIDSDGDGDFADETGVRTYATSGQIGVFGADDPATEARETIGYGVEKIGERLSLNFGLGSHSTMVAGAAAASRGTKGRIDGVAPGAQLLSIAAMDGASTAAYVRGIAIAYLDPRVDVVLIEGHTSLLGPYSPKDGRSLVALAISRLADRYPKPTVITAFNVPAMSQAADMSNPANVLSIGASDSAASLKASYGWRGARERGLHVVGAEGPSGEGALKPDLLSPASPVSLDSGLRWSAGLNLYPGVYRLPAGYTICAGTSCATPVAAGATALLVGAAKLSGLRHDAPTVHKALRDGADFDAGLPANKQGRGFLDIERAWTLMGGAGSPAGDYAIEVAAPVKTVISAGLARPNIGPGLFEREGWSAGERGNRTIWLTRRSGPKGPLRFDVDWQGADGAFASARHLTLPLGKAVPLKVDIAVQGPRVYSAIARLSRPGEPGFAVAIPATIVVPIAFEAKDGYRWTDKVALQRPGRRQLYFRVPEGTGAFSVTIKASHRARLMLFEPGGKMENYDPFAQTSEMEGTATLSVEAPTPGVWEVLLHENQDYKVFDWTVDGAKGLPDSMVEVTATVLGADIALHPGEVRLHNRLGAFVGGVPSGALGGRRSERVAVAPGETRSFDIEVEPGQPLLAAEIRPAGAAAGDVELHLFDCTTGHCWIARRGNQPGASQRVIVDRPSPGRWKAVIVASGAGAAPVAVDYADLYTHPKLGTLATTDSREPRKTGDDWVEKWTPLPGETPRAGYRRIGVLRFDADGFPTLALKPFEPSYQVAEPARDAILGLGYFELR